MRIAIIVVSFLLTSAAVAQGEFYSTSEGQILAPDGQPVVLKGVGLGGWLVPEGYMLKISAPDGGSPRSIRAQIVDLIGEADADRFYEIYRANYVAEKDIAQIADWGYDHIRLPFHYLDFWDPATETIREEGFTLVDEFLEWCRTYGIEVILDMHAAPGAQNSENISDSDGVARLWTEPDPYQDWTVTIWTEIARRYADETLIIGYDLINEPVLPESIPSSDLRALYVRLAEAIRPVDPNHILFIEGNYYATDFGALETPFDDNMVYAFHKYWNAPDQGSIQYLIDLREATGVPLWLGETGENSNPWFFATRSLAERNGIGWNWWTHKKIDATSSPSSAPFAPGYRAVVEFWRGNGARPSREAARNALFAMARGLDLDQTVRNPGVIRALFDDTYSQIALPYKDHRIPGAIAAADYDSGNQGIAYNDRDYWAVSGTPGGGNTGGAYRNDGVDIEASTDPQGAPYNVGWLDTLDWMQYTVSVDATGTYDIEFRVASGVNGGRLTISTGDQTLGTVTVPGTGGWQSWQSVYLRGVELEAGEQVLKVTVRTAGFNLNTMRFRANTTATEGDPGSETGLRVFPNPTAGGVTVAFSTPTATQGAYVVMDALGRQVAAGSRRAYGPGDHRVDIDLSLAPGVYMVRFTLQSSAEAPRQLSRSVTVSQ